MNQLIDQLLHELSQITIPTRSRANISFSRIRSITFGQVYHQFTYRIPQPSIFNSRFPKIWDLIQQLGKIIANNIPWTSVQLNHNVVCGPHIDKNNSGYSVIVSFGNYTGNNLVINEVEYNTNRNPLCFDGHQPHYNTPQLNGDKYSLTFFSLK